MHAGPPPNMHSVSSSNIARIGYWPEEGGGFSGGGMGSELWMDTNKGRRYVYFDVPQDVYDAFDRSPKGEYQWDSIRDKYAFVRLS